MGRLANVLLDRKIKNEMESVGVGIVEITIVFNTYPR